MARAHRGEVSRRTILVIVIAGGLFMLAPGVLIASLMSTVYQALEMANRAVCTNNLRLIGKACRTYGAGHRQRWPDAFSPESDRWDDVGGTRTDQWGTGPAGDQPPPAAPGDAEGTAVASNTASLWVLVAADFLTPASFLCPSAAHCEDLMVTRYDEVRDFRGDRFCSYSFQNMLGPYGLSELTRVDAAQLAIAADSSPLRRDRFTRVGAARETNRQMARKPEFARSDEHPSWRGPLAGPWELNSPNHRFAGQNVLYLDGHVVWEETPYCGPNLDNLWLRRAPGAAEKPDGGNLEAVRRANDTDSYDGKSTLPPEGKDDSFLVP